MKTIQNPILRGFNPDPSIIAVEDDFYIATSTFEWFPGVQIHHSKDLANWKLITHPLDTIDKLDMKGVPDSCGVWAPCLSYHEGTFYLVYSNVKSFNGVWKDTPNYLITSNSIYGPWSEPIFLNAKGFDGSLFHDDDGRKWYLSMLVDHRKGKLFGGIILQEYLPKEQRLSPTCKLIFKGSELGITEGPHLYKRNGYYYLLTAEGGTEYGHAITIARSKHLEGPYEIHPQNPIISASSQPEHPLQKAGHGDFVWTKDDRCFATFLVGRPLTTHGRCMLGRETAIEEIIWKEDGWPYAKSGSSLPRVTIELSSEETPLQSLPHTINEFEDFDEDTIPIEYASLRVPISSSWASLKAKPSHLRLFGQESLSSLFHQSLLARRLTSTKASFSTCVIFEPKHFQQLAGLVCYYNSTHYYYLHFSHDEKTDTKVLQLLQCNNQVITELLETPINVTDYASVCLKVIFHDKSLQFYYSTNQQDWKTVGTTYDASILSDDYVREGGQHYRAAFTGTFVGICCQDLSGERGFADFDWVSYKELQ